MTLLDQRVRGTFIALADTLVDDFDIIAFLDMLAQRCVDLLDVTAAGLLLVGDGGAMSLVAASTELGKPLGHFQLQNQEGPCLDCYTTGQVVRCPDLADARTRWPRFAVAAIEAGFAAVHALPLRLRTQVIGALDLYTDKPGALDAEKIGHAQAMADVATIGILHERAGRRRELVVGQLQTALTSRILIEQAKGMLAERLHTTMSEAFTLLRTHARNNNRRLTDLAAAVVDNSFDTRGLTEPAARPRQSRRAAEPS